LQIKVRRVSLQILKNGPTKVIGFQNIEVFLPTVIQDEKPKLDEQKRKKEHLLPIPSNCKKFGLQHNPTAN
jgi:hypothetical protein